MSHSTITLGLLGLIGCMSLDAQTIAMKANIPFDFHVGANSLPAGTYMVSNSAGVLRFSRAEDPGKSIVVLSRPTYKSGQRGNARLLFNRYADEYFFTAAWQAGQDSGITIPTSKRESELSARASGLVQTAGVTIPAK